VIETRLGKGVSRVSAVEGASPQPDWGRLIVISGASGSGKSTLVRRLLERPELRLKVSISATTRQPRPGERPGVDYLFLDPAAFDRIRPDLLESAEVHGYSYGTPAAPIRAALEEGYCVVLVIDVQGAFQVREKIPDALLIFIQVPSLELLEARLRGRASDDEATIRRRLETARTELALAHRYDHEVINDDLDRAVEELVDILVRNRCGAKVPHDR
jgi:guanylate kinase